MTLGCYVSNTQFHLHVVVGRRGANRSTDTDHEGCEMLMACTWFMLRCNMEVKRKYQTKAEDNAHSIQAYQRQQQKSCALITGQSNQFATRTTHLIQGPFDGASHLLY